jgi:hypothetical protein
MPKAKKAVKKQAAHPTPEHQLKETELLKLKLYAAEAEKSSKHAQLLIAQREAYIRQVDPEGRIAKMAADIRLSTEESQEAGKRYQDAVAAVEARLKISLAAYSYDDETGSLTRIA